MKRSVVLFTALATALAIAIPAGGAEPEAVEPTVPVPSNEDGVFNDESPSAWFVELLSLPTSQGGRQSTIESEHAAFRASAQSLGIDLSERFSYTSLWNGFSVGVSVADASRLALLPEVRAIYPVLPVAMPEVTPGGSPDLATALSMTGADVAQSELGLTGADVRVAIMDTGVDYHHPDLGGGFGPGFRVETGWDFVGDDFNANPTSPAFNPVPEPDPDPDDCNGHGTHVAGITGANGEVVGVAPEVTFGAYRVFGCDGSTTADIMIAAMERALEDDMDVLNMSIGSAFAWPGYPTAIASNNLVDEGMIVVASIGNSGAAGTFSAGAPGLGEKVIGVASFDNTHVQLNTFIVEETSIGYAPMANAAAAPTSGTEEVVFVGRGCIGDDYLADPSGKVALIERGVCTFREKAEGALAAGATAAIVHNNVPGNFSGTVGTPPMDFPVISISLADGLFIRDLEPVDLTWTDETGVFANPTGGLISSFSSYGLAPDLSVKPDIGAPGGSIRSTYPLELGGFATISGTSMASPHVAGAAALLLEARPGTPVSDVRDIFQNNADPAPWSLASSFPLLDHVHRQGAGMLDIDDAILATSRVSPGKLALGETGDGDPITRSFTVYNDGPATVVYDLGREIDGFTGVGSAAVATTGTFAEELGFWLTFEEVSMPDSVAIPSGGSAEIEVTFTAAPNVHVPNLSQFGGYITLTPRDEGEVLRVSYAGFGGDYQDLTILEPNPFGLPWLAFLEGGLFNMAEEGRVFTMEGEDIPYVLTHHHHQASSFTIEVYDASSGDPVHPVFSTVITDELLPRNSTSTSFFAWPWDGTRFHSRGAMNLTMEVPDGDYFFVLTVLKALGDPDNPDHVETWTSPSFTIDRPSDRPGSPLGGGPSFGKGPR